MSYWFWGSLFIPLRVYSGLYNYRCTTILIEWWKKSVKVLSLKCTNLVCRCRVKINDFRVNLLSDFVMLDCGISIFFACSVFIFLILTKLLKKHLKILWTDYWRETGYWCNNGVWLYILCHCVWFWNRDAVMKKLTWRTF